MTAIFLSDVHLRDAEGVKTKLVIRFLQEVASKFESIYILGDLFDVWPGTNAYLVRTFRPVIQQLKRLVEDGHRIHYLEGNHDFRLGQYFSESLGIKVYPDEIVETWNGQRIYMMHGDLGNPRALGYRLLRRLLRNDLVHAAAGLFPHEWVFNFGVRSSQLSRDYQRKRVRRDNTERNEAKVRQFYRQAADRYFRKGYDVVLMGHTHIPDDYTATVGGRQCRYINLGDWVKHFTYLEFDGSQFYTRSHPVKNL
jgi:UDP-2,3-diacylglucosamine hydrolase